MGNINLKKASLLGALSAAFISAPAQESTAVTNEAGNTAIFAGG